MHFEVITALNVPFAIEKGIIDAGHTWDPAKSLAIKMGYKVLADAQWVPGLIVDVLVFNSSVIDKRPKEIKAVIKALFEALDFLQNNRQEALQIMSEYGNMSVSEMEDGLRGIDQPDVKENLKFMQKSAEPLSLFSSGAVIIDFYLNRGQLGRSPNLDRLITPRFIEELGK